MVVIGRKNVIYTNSSKRSRLEFGKLDVKFEYIDNQYSQSLHSRKRGRINNYIDKVLDDDVVMTDAFDDNYALERLLKKSYTALGNIRYQVTKK
jgi:hypothetical protein